jgi:hypothetical protein
MPVAVALHELVHSTASGTVSVAAVFNVRTQGQEPAQSNVPVLATCVRYSDSADSSSRQC